MPEILYRKWRPRTFAELAGQEHVTTTLVNALGTGRVAHAYLFAGPRGTGKTTSGRLVAKALNCGDRQGGEPCNRCDSCQSFLSGRAMDLIELDAASNRGIEEIRSLRDKVAYASAGDFKVYLIDEVHMLTEAAFNALLKTLEEPPPHVVFVLATTEAHKVPATIVSRCQRFDFRRISTAAAQARLEVICEGEGFRVEPGALELIVRLATGSLRDAINLLDQLVTSYGRELSLEHVRAGLGLIDDPRAGELARLALAADLGHGLELIASVRDDGLDLRQFQRELVRELRALLLVKSGLEPKDGLSDSEREEMAATVADAPIPNILAALKAFGAADLKPDPNSTLPLDLALADCLLGRENAPVPVPRVSQRPETAPPARERSSAPPGRAAGVLPSKNETPPAAGPVKESAAKSAVANNGAPSGPLTLGPAREFMRPIFEAARKRLFNVGAYLNGACDITDANDSEITLAFKFPVHLEKVSDPGNLQVITAAVSEVLGRPLVVKCVLDPNVEPWQRRETASRSPLVRAAQEMGARILRKDEE